jgi:4-azaleucine resistance transporter AzlC
MENIHVDGEMRTEVTILDKENMKASHNLWTVVKDGITAAWPVLAQKAGLSPGEIGLMSLLVFAGSAQFIAVSMISGGAAAIPIILTTFTVNLRHLLMSSSLAVHLRSLNAGWLSLYAYGVTDESFALNMTRFREEPWWDWRRALVLNHTANLAWIFSTIIGGYGGQFIPAGAFGIDYALPAMFICLLVLQIRGSLYIAVAVIAGLLAVACALLLPGNAYIVAATAAAAIGVFLRKWHGKASKSKETL